MGTLHLPPYDGPPLTSVTALLSLDGKFRRDTLIGSLAQSIEEHGYADGVTGLSEVERAFATLEILTREINSGGLEAALGRLGPFAPYLASSTQMVEVDWATEFLRAAYDFLGLALGADQSTLEAALEISLDTDEDQYWNTFDELDQRFQEGGGQFEEELFHLLSTRSGEFRNFL